MHKHHLQRFISSIDISLDILCHNIYILFRVLIRRRRPAVLPAYFLKTAGNFFKIKHQTSPSTFFLIENAVYFSIRRARNIPPGKEELAQAQCPATAHCTCLYMKDLHWRLHWIHNDAPSIQDILSTYPRYGDADSYIWVSIVFRRLGGEQWITKAGDSCIYVCCIVRRLDNFRDYIKRKIYFIECFLVKVLLYSLKQVEEDFSFLFGEKEETLTSKLNGRRSHPSFLEWCVLTARISLPMMSLQNFKIREGLQASKLKFVMTMNHLQVWFITLLYKLKKVTNDSF